MSSEAEAQADINELREELNQLLDYKIQNEEIRSLYKTYLQLPGSSEKELNQFEKQYGVRLPDDFRAFYRHKDGSGYGLHMLYPGDADQASCPPFYLMSLDEIRETKHYFCDVDEKLEEHYGEEELRQLDPEIKPYLFHKPWIPFATMAGGSLYLMLDFDPTDTGTYGQIIMYVHDPDFVYYVAPSFTELLRMSNRNLKQMDEIVY